MAKKEEKKNARQLAYEKKQEKQGAKVVNWIFGVLIVLALCYMAYACYLMA